ncbi:unnamed protein product [Allacma fusca]|uniref:Uncharacterized protein n=1 Tax=Allacma fusca TaxID=39272 RepID=A0A8J2PW47_9HEXA|nr:unnamed protein product [Allacma fusca]
MICIRSHNQQSRENNLPENSLLNCACISRLDTVSYNRRMCSKYICSTSSMFMRVYLYKRGCRCRFENFFRKAALVQILLIVERRSRKLIRDARFLVLFLHQ